MRTCRKLMLLSACCFLLAACGGDEQGATEEGTEATEAAFPMDEEEEKAQKKADAEAAEAKAEEEKEKAKEEVEEIREEGGALKNPVKLWEATYQELLGTAPPRPAKDELLSAWPTCATGMVRTPLQGEMKRRQVVVDKAHKAPLAAWKKKDAVYKKQRSKVEKAFKAGEPTRLMGWDAFAGKTPATGKGGKLKGITAAPEMQPVRKKFQELARTTAPVHCKVLDVGTWNKHLPDVMTAAKSLGAKAGVIAGYMFVCVGPKDKTNTPFLVAIDAYSAVATVEVGIGSTTVTEWKLTHDANVEENLKNRVFAIARGTILEFNGYTTLARSPITKKSGKAFGFIIKTWNEHFGNESDSITPNPNGRNTRILWSMDFRAHCAHQGLNCPVNDGRQGPGLKLAGDNQCASELEARASEMLKALEQEKAGSVPRKRLLAMVKTLMPSDKGVKKIEAEEALKSRDYPTTVALYTELGDVEGLRKLAPKLAKGKTLELGIKAYRAALVMKPDDPALCLGLGVVLAKGDDPIEAIKLLKTAMTKSTDPKIMTKAAGQLKKLGVVLGESMLQ